jgi:vancomycin resistance protein YoaR
VTVEKDTTLWREPEQREREGGRAVLFVLLGLFALLAGGSAAPYFSPSHTLPRGTTGEGVDVGGHTLDSAAAELERGLASRVDAEIEVTAGEVERGIVPAAAGLSVDYAASVAEAGAQRSWSPAWLWDYYNGGDDLDAVVGVDSEVQQSFLAELSAETRTPAREGAVRLTPSGVKVTDATTGEELDTTAAAAELEAAFLSDTAVVLPMATMRPDIDSADVEAAVRDFANPAMSAPVTLRFGSASARLTPREYAGVIALEPQGGVLVPVLKPEKLDELLSAQVSGDGAAVDATVRLVDGAPQVIPARPGVTYEPDAVHGTFLELVTKPQGERETEVPSTVAKPEFSTKDARALGINEQVSTFTTYFPYAEYRNINIGRAAEIIDGTVLKPGETFSLNGTVGERTRENGFTEGFIISDGIFKEDLGGGVSQVATTTFNAAFFAGLQDVEHKPHSFYIDRYPVGREATVAWPTVDLKFTNDTPYGVLVSTSLQPSTPSSSGALTVSMWSTDYWDITASTGERYNFTSPETRRLDTEDCYPNEGYGGFDIDVTRVFRRAGESAVDHREVMHTHYIPSDTVICE